MTVLSNTVTRPLSARKPPPRIGSKPKPSEKKEWSFNENNPYLRETPDQSLALKQLINSAALLGMSLKSYKEDRKTDKAKQLNEWHSALLDLIEDFDPKGIWANGRPDKNTMFGLFF